MAAPAVKHPGELRWETRLLAVLILTLLVFGIAMVYGAASYQTKGGGLSIALSQFSGALLGGIAMLLVARVDYHFWQKHADDLYLFQGKGWTGSDLRDEIRRVMYDRLSSVNAPYNLPFVTNGVACTTVSMIAAALGIPNLNTMTDAHIEQIPRHAGIVFQSIVD